MYCSGTYLRSTIATTAPTVTAADSSRRDAGANPLGLETDQREDGCVRVVGMAADIGAYETQPVADPVFANGFDP